ncbi:MAG: DNA replication/repair protein RecF [Caulobacteraceae bacterium]|nr:DNA replication/repair protein RecF [Caulobacter sp.]
MPASALRSLRLTDFRSYARAELALEGGAAFLWGANGAGKTNLLEAISFLAPGKGLRGAAAAEAGRREPGESKGRAWGVAAVLADDTRIGTGVEPGAARRTARIDGEPAGPQRLAERVRLVWLTPAQDRLFTEAASERRRFLDRLCYAAEPSHAGHAAAYEKAMRERQRVLADAQEAGRPPDPAWLDALEWRMAAEGEAVAAARARTVEALAAEIAGRGDRPFPRARLQLDGEWAAPDTTPDYPHRLKAALIAARARDAAAGRALIGPHRGDLVVTHLEKDRPAAEGSTGEQKAMALNLVMAQAARLARAESVPKPILLLDEAAAHLDPNRRASLFDEIIALDLQAILTGTERALFDGLAGRAQGVHVDDARLLPDDADLETR